MADTTTAAGIPVDAKKTAAPKAKDPNNGKLPKKDKHRLPRREKKALMKVVASRGK